MQATAQRPTGVTILAVLAILGGLLGLLGGIALVGLGGLAATANGGGVVGGVAMLLGGGLLLEAVLSLAFGIGAWTLKPWAWTLGILSQGLSILVAVVLMIADTSTIGSRIVGVLISAAIIYYLFTPGVRRAFGRA